MKPTKLEASLILLNMPQQETDETKRAALLVGIHHTVRRKLQEQRNRASRAARGLPPVPSVPPVPVVPIAKEA